MLLYITPYFEINNYLHVRSQMTSIYHLLNFIGYKVATEHQFSSSVSTWFSFLELINWSPLAANFIDTAFDV
jgi:hypothetical protein